MYKIKIIKQMHISGIALLNRKSKVLNQILLAQLCDDLRIVVCVYPIALTLFLVG